MNEKWKDLPEEKEGATLLRVEATLDEYDILAENNTWGGITFSSIIFIASDVESKSDDEIEDMVMESLYFKTEPMTLKRSNGFVFVNFNFEDLDDGW